MNMLELTTISKQYPGGVQAVDQVSLTLKEGELGVLVGPSGCGKTTTLRMIAGLEKPDQGTIRIGVGRLTDSGRKRIGRGDDVSIQRVVSRG